MAGFRNDFVWGVASAAYQVEGGAFEDGRGLSVWDTTSHRPGAVYQHHNGDVACDTYHRYDEDSALMQQLGVGAYRYSVSWPRVMPEGVGKVNAAGLDYYDKLTDSLLARGIKPWVTLFHWDYPQALFDRGGWFSPDSPKWFADYTRVVVDRLSDRVSHWFTQNEPQAYIGAGHVLGFHAPGYAFDLRQNLLVIHHNLLAHGLSTQVIRQHAKTPPKIGAAPCGMTYYPVNPDSADDVEAARQLTFGIEPGNEWCWSYSWHTDPALLGKYPDAYLKRFADNLPAITDADMKTMHQPLDFFGVNLYHGKLARMGDDGQPQVVPYHQGYPHTGMPWPVAPQAIRYAAKFFYERYKLPIVITENGLSAMDWVHADGKVHDPGRVDFLTRYLCELRKAATDDGVDVQGYFQWSIMDNFEWQEGYSKRFGLVYLDYPTLERIPKDSFYFYQQVIKSNGDVLPNELAPLR